MSIYYERYSAYIEQIYSVLIALGILSAVLVAGWLILRAVYAKHSLRDLYEWIYLAFCGGLYLTMIVIFLK